MNKYLDKFLDVVDTIFNDTVRTIADFALCLIASTASLHLAIIGSSELLPNTIWWAFSIFIVLAGTRALRNLLMLGIDDEVPFGEGIYEED